MKARYRTEHIVEDGIEYSVNFDGDITRWYLNEKLHREQGPAIEILGEVRSWYSNDELHREQGPAVEYRNRHRSWYWHGVHLTEEVKEQGIDKLSPEEIKFWLPILAAQKSE